MTPATPAQEEHRFVALEFLGVDGETYMYRCKCGQCGGYQLRLKNFMALITQPYPVLIGSFRDLVLVHSDAAAAGGSTNGSNEQKQEPVPCICVQDSDLLQKGK